MRTFTAFRGEDQSIHAVLRLENASWAGNYLEDRIRKLERENEKLKNLDEMSLGLKLGLSGETLASYMFLKQHRGFNGSLADFLNMAVEDIFRIYGYEVEETLSEEDGRRTFYVRFLE